MGFSTQTGKIVLVGLFTLGYLGTYSYGFKNGFFEQIEAVTTQDQAKLPDTDIPLHLSWTGIGTVDRLFGTILCFFSPVFNGQSPRLTLLGLHFYGQLISTWMLMLVEGSRIGNAWKLVSFITLFGLLMENVAMALAVPAWCMLHLVSSTTILHVGSTLQRQTTLLVHPTEIDIMPWSVLIGCGIPSVMIFLTDASTQKPLRKSQQFWILLRMVHPLLTAVIQLLLSMFSPEDEQALRDPAKRNKLVAQGLRRVYTVATTVAVVSHAATLSLSLSSMIAPSLFSELYQTMLDPVALFKPDFFWTDLAPVTSIPAGALAFLQWDELTSIGSILVWAYAVNRNALSGEDKASGLLTVSLRTITWTVVGGPAAAAISLIKERDEFMLEIKEPGLEPSAPESKSTSATIEDAGSDDDVKMAKEETMFETVS